MKAIIALLMIISPVAGKCQSCDGFIEKYQFLQRGLAVRKDRQDYCFSLVCSIGRILASAWCVRLISNQIDLV